MRKNIKYSNAVLSICFAFAMLTGCTKDEILIRDFIALSENAYTFDASGNDKLTVNIDANAKWDVDFDAEWLDVERLTEKSIIITALSNSETSMRSAELLFTSGVAKTKIAIQQAGFSPTFAKLTRLDYLNGGAICSPNGKYLGGVMYEADETGSITYYSAVRINMETGKSEILESRLTGTISARAISDNGILICGHISGYSYSYGVNGSRMTTQLPSGYRNPNAFDISSDGSIMVGYAQSTTTYTYLPCKWVNGEFEELPRPAMDILGEVANTIVIYARGCSPDGSIIYGSGSNTYQAVYWKDGKVEWVAKDIARKMRIIVRSYHWMFGWQEVETDVTEQAKMQATNYAISRNGKYLVGVIDQYDTTVTPSVAVPHPFVFNTETQTATIVRDFPNNCPYGGLGLAVSNDGIVSYTTYEPQSNGAVIINFSSEGFVYDINSGTSMRTKDYIKQEHGISFEENNAYIYRYCLDRNLIFGTTRQQTSMGFTYPAWTMTW